MSSRAKTNNISLEVFVDSFVNKKLPAAESYRAAGYKQKNDRDNSRILANQYMRRPEVQQAIQDAQVEIVGQLKQLTLNSAFDFMQHDYPHLKPRDKINAIKIMMEKTGLDAPKRVEVHNSSSPDVNRVLEMLTELNDNPD